MQRIKWFLRLKIYEAKEWIEEHQVPLILIGTACLLVAVSMLAFYLLKDPRWWSNGICCGTAALAVIVVGAAMFMKLKEVVVDNWQSAKSCTEVENDAQNYKCAKCGSPLRTILQRGIAVYKCTKCGSAERTRK